MEGYIMVLQSTLKQVKHIGHNYSYTTYTCGEPHDRGNPNWKPFRHLWDYSEQNGYDFYVVRDIIFERIGRKLVCEKEIKGHPSIFEECPLCSETKVKSVWDSCTW